MTPHRQHHSADTVWAQTQLEMTVALRTKPIQALLLAQPSALTPLTSAPAQASGDTTQPLCSQGLPVEAEKTARHVRIRAPKNMRTLPWLVWVSGLERRPVD